MGEYDKGGKREKARMVKENICNKTRYRKKRSRLWFKKARNVNSSYQYNNVGHGKEGKICEQGKAR